MPHMHGTVNEVTRGSKAHQRRLMMTLTLTGTVFVAEIVGAIITGSLALLVDAGHMLTDMSVLIASTVTAVDQGRSANPGHLLRGVRDGKAARLWATLLPQIAAGLVAMILLFVGLYALIEAGMRLFGGSAEHVADSGLLLFFGILGLAANVGSIIILAGQHNDNMNMKAAFLEVVNDALGSVAVIASAVVMMLTGWDGFDAIAGGLIALLMIPRAVKLLRDALKVLLEETPDGLNLDEVRTHLENIPHVVAVHDLHASTVSTGMPMLMAHVVVEPGMSMDQAANVLSQLQDCLREHFPVSIPHTTFQLEPQGYRSPSAEQLHS